MCLPTIVFAQFWAGAPLHGALNVCRVPQREER